MLIRKSNNVECRMEIAYMRLLKVVDFYLRIALIVSDCNISEGSLRP